MTDLIYLNRKLPVCHFSHFGEHELRVTLLEVMEWHSQVQQAVGIGGGREGELLCPDS